MVATPDLLLIRSELEVLHTTVIKNGDLHFYYNLGVWSSEKIFLKDNFIDTEIKNHL